jgi:hypothetical protein
MLTKKGQALVILLYVLQVADELVNVGTISGSQYATF